MQVLRIEIFLITIKLEEIRKSEQIFKPVKFIINLTDLLYFFKYIYIPSMIDIYEVFKYYVVAIEFGYVEQCISGQILAPNNQTRKWT